MMWRNVMTCLLLTALSVLSGCGGPSGPSVPEGDPGLLEDLVYNTSANYAEKEKFEALYVDGAAPSDSERQKFSGKSVNPEKVNVNGTTATIEVIVTKYVNYEPVDTTVTWEATKVGEEWKLTKSPLE